MRVTIAWSEGPPTIEVRRVELRSDSGELVGVGDLVILENRFRRERGDPKWRAATIENVRVEEVFQSQGYGRTIVEQLKQAAVDAGCYKIVLTTRVPKLVAWYAGMGFSSHGTAMRLDLL